MKDPSELSIYDPPKGPVSTGTSLQISSQKESVFDEARGFLAQYIRVGRLFLLEGLSRGETAFSGAASSIVSAEESISAHVAQLKGETEEPLLPGMAYAIVAGMFGTVVTRQRGIMLRTIVPVACFIGAGYYFSPQFVTNIGRETYAFEKKHMPQLADAQDQLIQNTRQGMSSFDKTTAGWRKELDHQFDRSLAKAEEITGIQLRKR